MEAKVQNQIQKSKQQIERSRQAIASSRELLDKFRKGFRGFESMHLGENFIVYKMPTPNLVKSAMEKAQQRISENNLPLQVTGGNHGLKHFIVKTI